MVYPTANNQTTTYTCGTTLTYSGAAPMKSSWQRRYVLIACVALLLLPGYGGRGDPGSAVDLRKVQITGISDASYMLVVEDTRLSTNQSSALRAAELDIMLGTGCDIPKIAGAWRTDSYDFPYVLRIGPDLVQARRTDYALSRLTFAFPIAAGLLALAVFGYYIVRRRRPINQARSAICGSCNYDLRASQDRCPECGTAIPPRPLAGRSDGL